ncbi:hypothetical protein KR093_009917 [Drosophila rubida]|uniref:Uncharacterized protein n=1 Tax=Drosophila rubida TaxID=30044 RepID=A0AAD4PIW5_9MUSC|nr:hypothetical protein KR093_009917 [Drosophila rubida]
MANSRQETEKMLAGGSIINGSHDGSLTHSPANGQNATQTLMRHSPDIKKHPHTHPHPYDK